MSMLLKLPYELRAIILENALLTPYEPPINPWTGADKRQPLRDYDHTLMDFGPRHTLYDTSLNERLASTCQALLLTNHQIRKETRVMLQRLEKPNYELDVMMVHEWDLWPTWLSVPVVRTHADEVNVTFRLFGHRIQSEQNQYISGDGGHNGPEWCFYSLLERYIAHGPVTEPQPERKDRGFFIKTLTLNIKSAADELYPLPPPELVEKLESRKGSARRFHGGHPDLANYAMPPECLARDLGWEIKGLLRLGRHRIRYGATLYEHIGTIRMLIEGRLVEEIDLTEELASKTCDNTKCTGSREDADDCKFCRWQRDTVERRAKEGLSVVPTED